MEITIDVKTLKSALESTVKAIDQKPTIPALGHFYFSGNGETLTVTGSGTATTIRECLPCKTKGEALLPTNLLELVRTLPDENITMAVNDKTAEVSWKSGHSSFPVFDPKDYPEIKETPDTDFLTIKGEVLTSALAHTVPHTAVDELRPAMTGVLFRTKPDGTMDMVASDSHTLGLYNVNCENKEGVEFDFVVPASALKLVANLAKLGDVEILADSNNIFFRSGATTLITREIAGKFPKYDSVIPQSFGSTLTADKTLLTSAIKRVLVCSNKASGHIKLSLDMLETNIEAQDLSFSTSAKESPEGVKFDGSNLTIGFKGESLLKCITAIESDEVIIKFTEAKRAAVVTSDEDPCIMLVMPVQI